MSIAALIAILGLNPRNAPVRQDSYTNLANRLPHSYSQAPARLLGREESPSAATLVEVLSPPPAALGTSARLAAGLSRSLALRGGVE